MSLYNNSIEDRDDLLLFESVMEDCKNEEDDDEELSFLAEEIEATLEKETFISQHISPIVSEVAQTKQKTEILLKISIGKFNIHILLSDEILEKVFAFSDSKLVCKQWLQCSNKVQRERWRLTLLGALNFQAHLIGSIENALFELFNFQVTRGYKQAARRLAFNLKQTETGNNNALRERVEVGELTPYDLVRLDSEQLAPQKLQQQRKAWCKKRTHEVTRHTQSFATETDAFQCDRCGGTKCKYIHWRRKRQVDRTRMLVSCVTCFHSWEH